MKTTTATNPPKERSIHSSDEASTSNPSSSSCPYAVALQDDSDVDDDLVQLTRQSCPAFANNTCPFQNASPEEVRQTLAKVPPSHWTPGGSFARLLSELHAVQPHVAGSTPRSSFILPGGCPVAHAPELRDVLPAGGFAHAMEDLSLAAFMARMAHSVETQHADVPVAEAGHANLVRLGTNPGNDPATSPTDSSSTNAPTAATLSQSLKQGTAVAHQAAEDVHFVRNFIRGQIDRDVYARMVVCLYHVYEALEVALDEHAPRCFPSLHFPTQLRRVPALAEDLDFWVRGGENAVVNEITPATQDYVDRIRHIARTDPVLLLAHSYTRYLGDLSGGKILARVAKRALQLDTDGLAFYEFPQVPSLKLFKDEYRRALDDSELRLTPAQRQHLVSEANVAFLLNMRIFEELDVLAGVPNAQVRPLQEALRFANVDVAAAAAAAGSADDQCPFLVRQSGTQDPAAKSRHRCPWPFVFFHDPLQGCRDWQTWACLATVALPGAGYVYAAPIVAWLRMIPSWAWGVAPLAALLLLATRPFQKSSGPWMHWRVNMRDWKSWALLAVILCAAWSRVAPML
jgi:heme oxygenase